METKEKKTTSEKPVSLAPLDFKESLAALLKVKPKPKEEKAKEKKDQKIDKVGCYVTSYLGYYVTSK